MSVDIYTGTLGSGKSLDAVLTIEDCLNNGKNVIANFKVSLKNIRNRPTMERIYRDKKDKEVVIVAKSVFVYVPDEELNVKYLVEYYKKYHRGRNEEGITLIVIDEASMFFNARNWNDKERANWIKFIRHSRKLGFDIIMITQMFSDIDKQIRGMFDYNVVHRKLGDYKMFKYLQLFGLNFFVRVYVNLALNDKDRSSMFAFKKRYSLLYDTYEMFFDIDEVFNF